MTFFFIILSIILTVNVAMMLVSFNLAGQKKKRPTDGHEAENTKILPMDFISSKYKKAV